MLEPSPTLTRTMLAALLIGSLAGGVAAQGQKEPSAQPGTSPAPAGQPAEPKPTDPKQPGSELPGGGKPAPPVPAAGIQLEITSLKAGQTQVQQRSGFGGSFLTNTADTLELSAEARVKGRPELQEAISWQVNAPLGFTPVGSPNLSGSRISLRFQRKGGNPTGAGGYLSLTLRARMEVDGQVSQAQVLLMQDARDRLRQEYLDLGRTQVPSRDDLLDDGQYYRRFGRKYSSVTFNELNSSRSPATGQPYPAVPLTEELVRTLHLAERAYGKPLTITSGFRNPVRQLEVHAEVEQSHHQYGRAADLLVPPSTSLAGKQVASEQDWLRLASAALQGGGRWIEPLTSSDPNTDHCHVHVDVRPGPVQSRVVTVRGQVTDPSGNPVPGARVLLAGMPAVANQQGQYQLKHVLSSQQEQVAVEAAGRGTVTRDVTLVENPVLLTVTVPADPNPTLLARLEPAARDANGAATLRLVLKNTGLSNAQTVRIAPRITGTAVSLSGVLPQQLESIPAGSEGAFNLQLAVSSTAPQVQPVTVPVEVAGTYTTPAGQPREQRWTLSAQIDPAPAAPIAAAPAAAAPTGRPLAVLRSPSRGGIDAGAALAGLVLGALAGTFSVLVMRPRRAVQAAAAEASAVAAPAAAALPTVTEVPPPGPELPALPAGDTEPASAE